MTVTTGKGSGGKTYGGKGSSVDAIFLGVSRGTLTPLLGFLLGG